MGLTNRYKWTSFDPAADGAKKFKEYIEKDSKGNLESLDTELGKVQDELDGKVNLNGVGGKSNFNFIENKVVQNGLVDAIRITNNDSHTILSTSYVGETTFIINARVDNSVRNGYIIKFNKYNIGVKFGGNLYLYVVNTQDGSILGSGKIKYTQDSTITVVFKRFEGGKYIASTDSEFISAYNNNEKNVGGNAVDNSIWMVGYNRILNAEEINNNIQAMSNSPSINSLEVKTGDKIETLKLSSDSYHTTMANGYNVEQAYTGLLKSMGKEFVSADGSSITVNNGIEYGKVISGEIQGQTVKNYSSVNTIVPIKLGGDGAVSRSVGGFDVVHGKYYTIQIECNELNGLSHELFLTDESMSLTYFRFTVNKLGINRFRISAEKTGKVSRLVRKSSQATDSITSKVMIMDDGINYDIGYFTGLSSTQAVISNNNLKYPFYEPTIQGKTRILKALKGTQNWVEISPDEARDTVTYDYKLENTTGDLGSVPSINDYVDVARKVKVVNTKEIVLNGSESWASSTVGTNTLRFNYSPHMSAISARERVICNNINSISNTLAQNDIETINTWEGGILSVWIDKTKLTTQDVTGFKAWLQTNPTTVRYQLSTPTITQLTDEEFKAYDSFKKLISCGGLGGTKDTFKLLDDGSCVNLIKTKELKLDKIYNWDIANNVFTSCISFRHAVDSGLTPNKTLDSLVCNILPVTSNNDWDKDVENIRVMNNGHIEATILRSKLSSPTIEGFKEYLRANNAVLRGRLVTPISVFIPKEASTAVPIHDKINILEVGDGVSASSFKVVAPVDRVAELLDRVSAVEKATINLALK